MQQLFSFLELQSQHSLENQSDHTGT